MKKRVLFGCSFVALFVYPAVGKKECDTKSPEVQSIMCRYDQDAPPFSLCFGKPFHKMPDGRKLLLIYFSALTCPQCALFHRYEVDQLIEQTRNRSSFSLIIRDYPIDGLSLRGSACVWATKMPQRKRRGLLFHIFQEQMNWIEKAQSAVSEIEKIVISQINPSDQRAVSTIKKSHTDTSKKSIMQAILSAHNMDQKMFDIQGVPFAVLIMQDTDGSYSTDLFHDPKGHPKIKEKIASWLK